MMRKRKEEELMEKYGKLFIAGMAIGQIMRLLRHVDQY